MNFTVTPTASAGTVIVEQHHSVSVQLQPIQASVVLGGGTGAWNTSNAAVATVNSMGCCNASGCRKL
ncbi:MAG: hypothetical protein U0T32_07400 [Chitinophagales bacterium]